MPEYEYRYESRNLTQVFRSYLNPSKDVLDSKPSFKGCEKCGAGYIPTDDYFSQFCEHNCDPRWLYFIRDTRRQVEPDDGYDIKAMFGYK